MSLKIFRWTEFILYLSTQGKKQSAVSWQVALPPRLGRALAHCTQAEPPCPPSWTRKAIFPPKDPPVAQLEGKEKWHPKANVLSWVLVYVHLKALERLSVGVAYWPWHRPPGAQSSQLSGTHCFMGYLVFCQPSFTWPSFSQMALNSTC